MCKKRLLIADDHANIRQSLRQLLAQEEDMDIAGEACDGVEVLEKVRTGKWDLLILDLSMPRKNGFEVLKELQQDYPDLPVLILSVHPSEQYEARSLQLGARSYIVKDRAPEELVLKINEALSPRR